MTFNKEKFSLSRIRGILLHGRNISKDRIHAYWINPDDGNNMPEGYYERGYDTTKFLADKIVSFLPINAKTLEIGTNVGRNLYCLYQNQYHNLTGIEISENAVNLMKEKYPDMYKNINIINKPVESVIKDIPDNEFDLVYTVAVLEHIHWDSAWIFKEIARISKSYLLTIEDENTNGWRHFPRNYKRIFTKFKMELIETINCRKLIQGGFYYRLFKKQSK